MEEAELVEKQGWERPTVDRLREILSLKEDTGGLDEASLEALSSLEMGEVAEAVSSEEEASTLGRSMTNLQLTTETVQEDLKIARNGRWFAASVDGRSQGDESVASELQRCFERISSKYTSLIAHPSSL